MKKQKENVEKEKVENVENNEKVENQEKAQDVENLKKDKMKQKVEKAKKDLSYGAGTFVTLSIFLAITIAVFVLSGYIYGETSIFNQAISSNAFVNWMYNKVPAMLKSIQIITIAWILSIVLRLTLKKMLARTTRGITIVKLINSFIKYLIVIIALLMILSAWGVNTQTLIASAGILSLVIGLGAQSLIADIIAGFFIVFEREFQVGDIVIIDGWRGTVDEIGIRTTKIIDWQGNIKIVNNSEISTIINQSRELSITTCVVSIDYRESIPRVELIIKNNLERIKKNIPEIIDGPYYKGVDSLSDSSVNLLFIATVKEANYYVVQRALNREIKMIFDENDVSIPFPQVTLNQPEEFANKVTKTQEKQASKFVKEQIEVSKDLEDTN